MPRKRGPSKKASSTPKKVSSELEKKLVENIIELQKVNIDLAEKFSSLEKQISSLLKLFESAAKSFASNPMIQASEKDKEFLDKIDKLLDQNKVIAKGLTLMEDRVREKINSAPVQSAPPQGYTSQPAYGEDNFRPPASGKPLPRF